jgi:hypothetical protein
LSLFEPECKQKKNNDTRTNYHVENNITQSMNRNPFVYFIIYRHKYRISRQSEKKNDKKKKKLYACIFISEYGTVTLVLVNMQEM